MPPAWHRGPAVPAAAYLPGCTGKMGWESRSEAVRVADRRGHGFLYRCKHCKLWHTSTQGKIKPRKAEA